MIFKDEYDKSSLTRWFFIIVILIVILVSGLLMFADRWVENSWLESYKIIGDFTRKAILMICLTIYFLRLLFTVFVFLKRKMGWIETILISGLMSLALFSFAKVGGSSHLHLNALDYIGILLFFSGSWINSYSEYTRHIWKKNDINKGKLYTGGLFKYSMHINYFGDIILFTGLALITQSFSLLVIPLIMALNFVLFIIPSLDKYLVKKYGEEFKEYASKTKKFIPMIY
jgi:protein-S-isoprenylcysteine O-methyltransferase Ste14